MNHMMFGINMNSLVNFKRHVVYRECVHNHAASLGGVARDGCYEFLQPRLVDGGSPEEAMRCAVCGCHRNYHRRQIVLTPPMPPQRPPTVVANEGNVVEGPVVEVASPPLRRRKWKRTNFTEEQKSRMASFAEMLGWRVKRADKEETLRFCMEIGITRKMFVVWLNNNRRENPNQTNE